MSAQLVAILPGPVHLRQAHPTQLGPRLSRQTQHTRRQSTNRDVARGLTRLFTFLRRCIGVICAHRARVSITLAFLY